MTALFTLWHNWRSAPLGILLALGLLLPGAARASHIRAGQIEAKVDTTAAHNPNRIFFKLTIYQNLIGTSADQPQATLYFGDGTSQTSDRISGIGPKQVIPIPGNPATGIDIFYFDHTYPGAKTYPVSFNGELRNAGILNFPLSGSQSFYIDAAVTIDPALGVNHSPVLRTPPIDQAGQNQVYVHNPGAYDADGDSLSFRLVPCQQAAPVGTDNTPVPGNIPGYVYPNQTPGNAAAKQAAYSGVPAGTAGATPAIFTQDPRTGQITWNTPLQTGLYNIAFYVDEWRRGEFGKKRIGFVRRDMQITVVATTNLRPVLKIPRDTCVVAGTTVTGAVTATDGTAPGAAAQTPVTLTAYSGVIPPARFIQTTKGPPTASGTFTWATDCSNVAKEPYSVVFKAQDTPASPADVPLVDEQVWRITVVGPPPQNLVATPTANQVSLTWDRYTCTNASFIRIYRREGCLAYTPGPCDTGLPASTGYVLIGSVAANLSAFKDDNNGAGLARGKTYSYRIYADFPLPGLGASLPSAEACVTLVGPVARLKNVDVDRTDVAGQITVRWSPAKLAITQLLATPSGYRLSRAVGLNPAATAFALVRADRFALTDSVFVDAGLNTTANQYTYRLDLVYANAAGTEVAESQGTASSVRAAAIANGLTKTVAVSWTYQTPWDNSLQPALVFRSATGPAGPFAQVGAPATAATGGTFTDSDPALVKGQSYCYYVQTNGRYPAPLPPYLSGLLNKSQITCATLVDQPCVPVLTLAPANCDSLAALPFFPANNQRYSNSLRWTVGSLPAGCNAAASYYRIFYRPGTDGAFTLLDSTTTLAYVHRNLLAPNGCYAVQAVGAGGVRSALSNVACQTECVFFLLPNIFTPNGDGVNDLFQPKTASPLRSVHFQAFNRWGVKVFENTTTASIFIRWDGGGAPGEAGTSGKVSEGLYYYLAEVQFADAASTTRTYKGWVQVIR
ncbi:gliding motility-associated C-terminal domain-containing protein [Hymenobacter caeli]|uniref:Gliding motility-associated-like protein n=1 Tax=Hymenobacter caeli TaxID=2735894 RepID=A0ABX2FNZ6_9BACT|nr:gliding motility-associated C-terminal domain-containing protein [Hymenobacter caeli]NRT18716.1 gliding motility-associated-like protein [Hymenobacter caeli]